jgi:hypothetical protein
MLSDAVGATSRKEQDVGVVMHASKMTAASVLFAETKPNLEGRVKRRRHAFIADVLMILVSKEELVHGLMNRIYRFTKAKTIAVQQPKFSDKHQW